MVTNQDAYPRAGRNKKKKYYCCTKYHFAFLTWWSDGAFYFIQTPNTAVQLAVLLYILVVLSPVVTSKLNNRINDQTNSGSRHTKQVDSPSIPSPFVKGGHTQYDHAAIDIARSHSTTNTAAP